MLPAPPRPVDFCAGGTCEGQRASWGGGTHKGFASAGHGASAFLEVVVCCGHRVGWWWWVQERGEGEGESAKERR